MQKHTPALILLLAGCQQGLNDTPPERSGSWLSDSFPAADWELPEQQEEEDEPTPEEATSLEFAEPKALIEVENHRLVTHGDIDGDGHMDFLVADTDGRFDFLRGDGTGSFTQPTPEWTQTAVQDLMGQIEFCRNFQCSWNYTWLNKLELADLDGDGKDEALISMTAQASSEYWTFVGTLSFDGDDCEATLLGDDNYHLSAEIVADLDGDGGSEILLYTWEDSFIVPNGRVENKRPFAKSLAGNYYPKSSTIDLNHDGRLDLINFYNGGYGFMGVTAFLSEEDGSFTEFELDNEVFGSRVGSNGSLNDSANEVIMGGYQQLHWIDTGDTPEMVGVTAPEEVHLFGAIFGDFSGDDSLDVLFANNNKNKIEALRGDGDGGFDPIESTSFDLSYQDQVADINQDGLDDIYRVSWNPETQQSLLNVLMNVSR